MAQVKLLKIGSDGVATEFASATDEITLASFTVQGGGPVLSSTGLDMNGQNITDVPEVHSAAALKLIADAGDVELKASTDLVKFVDSTAVLAGSVDTAGGQIRLQSAVNLQFQSLNNQFQFLDSGTIQQLAIDVSAGATTFYAAGNLQLDSLGDINIKSATDQIYFFDASSAQQGAIKTNGAEFTIQSSVGDIVLSPASLQVDASSANLLINTITFVDPAVSTINQTIGNLVIDNIMATDRDNTMASTSSIYFQSITDSAGEVDSFKLPNLAGVPTASPALDASGGWMVYDSTNKNLYIWDGTAWDNQSSVSSANSLDLTFVAGENLAAGDAVYIDASGQAFKADNDSGGASEAIGFARSTVLAAASVDVRVAGKAGGLAGLTVGARYYIGESGAVTSTVPAASGEYIVQMGYAVSATEIVVQVLQLGRRA